MTLALADIDGNGTLDLYVGNNRADPDQADAGSEVVLINQHDQEANHNGGDLHFGPDGYLYVSVGDEGGAGDTYQNSQRIDKNFFSGILRLDVDKRAGNPEPNPHPSVITTASGLAGYSVPADNPFVGATSFNGLPVDSAKVRTEFWAVFSWHPLDVPGNRPAFPATSSTATLADVITNGPFRFYRVRIFEP